jgi:hypothetical protein
MATKDGIDKFVYGRFQRTCLLAPPSSPERRSCSVPTAASTRTDLVRSDLLGVVAGVRRNGPVWPHAQRTAERRQHMCSALLPLASAPGPKLWPYVCAVIKLNTNMAMAYI